MRRSTLGSCLAALLTAAAPALAAPAPAVVTLEDPRDDDRGPGSYLYPTGAEYRPGDFDLRRFSVRVEGQDAVFEVTLGANVRRNIVAQRGDRGDLILDNGIYTQNVDIYLDTTPGAGFTRALPGRRVAFQPGSGWERAIAIVPRPGAARSELATVDAEMARHVITPGPVRSSGQTLTVRVPLAQLGGPPRKDWGYSVMVSGAAWDASFSAVDWLRGMRESNMLTLPVYGVPEERAFGGGNLGSNNPHVIDVILPPGVSQADVLGSFGPDKAAIVPMVYPGGASADALAGASSAPAPSTGQAAGTPPPAPAPAPAPAPSSGQAAGTPPSAPAPAGPVAGGPLDPSRIAVPSAPTPVPSPPTAPGESLSLEIASITGDTAVIPTPKGGPRQWQLGTVVDGEGRKLGRVVVTDVSNGFVLANITDGKGEIRPGHRVHFAQAGQRPSSPPTP
ncbi:MAG: hypothetical protein L0Y64_20165 [Myxococcaceae bacterium]|nr:hypothetical protein [Myxococcaceae bacterium]